MTEIAIPDAPPLTFEEWRTQIWKIAISEGKDMPPDEKLRPLWVQAITPESAWREHQDEGLSRREAAKRSFLEFCNGGENPWHELWKRLTL